MIDDLAATIVMEAWDPSSKCNTTFSHAWATAPANVVARHIAGVQVLTPGAALVRIAPQPGPLERFRATVPTIRGAVRVGLDRADRFRLVVALPPNMDGRIELDLAALGIADPERLRVRTDGPRPARGLHDGRLVLSEVGPGTTRVFG
jgi:alpha-L-rhamnosidase